MRHLIFTSISPFNPKNKINSDKTELKNWKGKKKECFSKNILTLYSLSSSNISSSSSSSSSEYMTVLRVDAARLDLAFFGSGGESGSTTFFALPLFGAALRAGDFLGVFLPLLLLLGFLLGLTFEVSSEGSTAISSPTC